VLKKFHGKDATRAFDAAGHSEYAYTLLKNFLIRPSTSNTTNAIVLDDVPLQCPIAPAKDRLSRWRAKLFTKEDVGIHKYCGLFVLVHFAFRFFQTYFGDPSAGMGTRMGKGSTIVSLA